MKKVLILLFFTASCSGILAQRTVRGRIISDDDGDVLPGASIVVKGSTTGVTSDVNGNYSINAPSEQSILQFTFIGFVTEEIVVGNQSEINVRMKSGVRQFEELVLIGYGEQRKASIVGAVSNIKSDDLRRAAPSNLTANIGGRITGALVRLGDGNVGGADSRWQTGELDDATIVIRGRATSNPTSPLVIVDGVESNFNRINPEDVEQLSILKDASATAVYGVRGANGVILITTKQGNIGKPKIRVNAQVRAHQPLKYPRPLGSYQYALLHNEAERNSGVPETYSPEDLEHYRLGDDPYFHPDVDWYDELVKPYFLEEQYNASITGGTENVKYYISGEYNHAGGPWKTKKEMENDYKRYNLRTNFDFNITKTTELSVKLNGRMENRGDAFYGESTGNRYYGSFWYHISHVSPNIAPIRWPNGSWATGRYQNWNVRALLDDGGYRTRFTNALDASTHLKQKLDFILPGLTASALYSSTYASGYRIKWGEENVTQLFSYSVDPVTGEETYKQDYDKRPHGRNPDVAIQPGESGQDNSVHYIRKMQTEFRLNYSRLFNEVHRLDLLALVQQSQTEDNWAMPLLYRGFSGRFNYAYKMKYLLDVSAAYNGSDRFAKGERYAWFPAVGLGYVISEENFWKDNLAFFPYLKFRVSYGTVGNDRLASSLRYMYKYEFNSIGSRGQSYGSQELYSFGETPQGQPGITEGALANEHVTWEVAKKYNAGVDLRIWDDRIKLSADIFREKRDNILAIRGDVPTQAGISGTLPASNIRKTTNGGYEFELSISDSFGDFDFTIGGNYSFARSNVVDWAEAPDLYEYRMAKGQPVGQPLAYLWSGKFYEQEDIDNPNVAKPEAGAVPGDLMFVDLSGDGIIDGSDQTRKLGNGNGGIGYGTLPEIVYGFNTNFGYKGFYVDLFWQGVAHVNSRWVNGMRYEFNGGPEWGNVYSFHLDRWVHDPANGLDTRATAKYPRLAIGGAWATTANSSFQRLNSSFLRLKSVEIGYNFPKQWIKNIGMSDLRLFVGGSNVLTFDKIGWVDPEYNPEDSGNRGNSYPQTKFYSIGINASF